MATELHHAVERVMRGAGVGALLGAVAGGVGFYMQMRSLESQDLGVEGVTELRRHPSLMAAVTRFQPAAAHSDRARRIYEQLVSAAEFVASRDAATGREQFKAHRASLTATAAGRALAKCAPTIVDANDVDELQTQCEVLMHNMML
jgi:predicted lipid-binding transport protein (Tim44 family)